MEAALLQAAAWQETLASRGALQAQVDLITNMRPQPNGKLGGEAGGQNTFKTPNCACDENTAEPMTNLMRRCTDRSAERYQMGKDDGNFDNSNAYCIEFKDRSSLGRDENAAHRSNSAAFEEIDYDPCSGTDTPRF